MVEDDPHALWRIVANNFRQLEANAPDGHVPIAEAYLAGAARPIQVSRVETRRDGFGWGMLHSITDRSDKPGIANPSDRYVFFRLDLVERVELRFVRVSQTELKKHPIGFAVDDDGESLDLSHRG